MTPGGQVIGYRRVSSVDQNLDRQLQEVECFKVFEDKASGKDTKRPDLLAAMDYVRTGDTLVVHSIDRLARSMGDLLKVLEAMRSKGVTVKFVKENLEFTAEANPMQELQLHMLGAFAQFERALILERQREGIAAAKERGAYKGRKKVLKPEQVQQLRDRIAAGEQKAKLAKEYGVSRQTLYVAIKEPS